MRAIVADEWAFRAALAWTGQSRALKAGEYRFDRPMSVVDVIDKIARGDVYAHPITFPEGLTIREMAAMYRVAAGSVRRDDFIEAARDGSLVSDLDPLAQDLEGYLFPGDLHLAARHAGVKLISMMVARFRDTYADLEQKRSGEPDLSVRQVVTLASLVEKETGKAEERPLVAAVYRNRLTRNMPMQADPTVVYALVKAGTYDGNIRKARTWRSTRPTTPISTRAFRPGRSPRLGAPRSRRRWHPPMSTTSTSSVETTGHMCLPKLWLSTTPTSTSTRCCTSGSSARSASVSRETLLNRRFVRVPLH